MTYKYCSYSPEETRKIACNIIEDRRLPLFIALNGDLGAGKTEFVRGIGEKLGIKKIQSPTFTIIREYQSSPKLYHFDVYRMDNASELEDIGFYEYLNESDSIIVMEWADKVKEILPENRLNVDIYGSGNDLRTIVCTEIAGNK